MLRIILVAFVALAARGTNGAATPPAPNCGSNPADIVFLLDSSGSVGSTNFQKQLDFVSHFAQSFDIGPRNVEIGVVTFATSPHNEFNLNTHTNKNDLVSAIHKIAYHSGGTRTDLALKYVEANSFTKAAGDRDQVANILIVMTDGKSNQPSLTTTEAAHMHSNLNAKVFAIGIGAGVDKAELGRIATDSAHVFQVSNFDALNTLQAELKKTACKIDGGWTKWGSYSPCTKSCGGGTHFRERSCTNPRPANGGADCVGSAKETQACNAQACPTTPPPTTTTAPKTTPIPTTIAPGCGTQPADIVFILDASGSVGAANFNKMLQFVNTLVDGFPIGANDVHIGMLTFDSKVYNQFHLNKYNDKTSIKNAVTGTRYTSGTTHTSDAIKYARETSFSTQNGMRPGAAKIAIIVTDGQSNNAAATASEAALLRQQGVTVFSIGVGSGAKVSELNAMATDPDNTHVFQVTDFNSLSNIKGSLTQKTCEVKATTMPPTTPAPKAQCEAQADIVFLLDSSGSVGSANFQKMKTFVHDIQNSFNIGPNAVQVGVDTFQTSVKSEFNMNQYTDRQTLQNAINNIQYHSGLTHTGEAIRFMATDSFSAAAGDRPNVPNIAIVVTDGQSNNPTLTAAEAKKARDAGITILAIGVGSGASKSELNTIATDPDSTHVYMADNFDALTSLKALLSSKACDVSKPAVNNTAPTCAAKADILFVLDSSGSIGQANYNKMLQFVRDVTSKFDIGPDKIRVGTEIFSDRTYIQFNLNKYNDVNSLDQAIANIPYKRGTTNTGQALKDAYTKMFTAANGDRAGVPNIAIVVTDGKSTNRPSTLSEAQKLRNQGVQVFAVGVGGGVDMSELNAMATDPDSTHVLTVQDFSQLQQITASLNNKACQAIPPTGMSLTPVPGTTISPDPCQDQNANCAAYDIPAICTDYAGWSRDNCQKSCGFCQGAPATPPPCMDMIPNCHEYALDACTNFKPWAMDNCRQYCGFCSLKNAQQTLTGYFGSCYYNGKSYSQGQTWDDGCSYECTCDDAASGKYSCYNKCPLYFNMPPQCTLVKKGGCCLEPVCEFGGTHLTTNGQNLGQYNGVNVCMYKNTPYYEGQTWQDGCDKTCFCQDGSVGLWTCQSVCAHYDQLPSECHLERQAGKCCEEPVCTFNKQYGQFTGSGTLSGKGSGATTLTTPGPCVDKDPNCIRYPKSTCTDPQYTTWAHDQCQKYCGYCPSMNPTPGPNDMCIYNGVAYQQGQRWDDGCDLECICENAMYGFYRCQKKCADIVNLPLGCTQVKAVGDCCAKIQCSGTTGTFTGSQTITGTIGGAQIPSPMGTAAPLPGQTITGTLNGCLYKGMLYTAGRRWDDGCDYTCVCEDGATGQYKCTPKCPSFGTLPTGCTMQDNPNDPCCQQPVCAPGTTTTNGQPVVLVPTYGKGFTGYGLPVMPAPGTGTSGTSAPGTMTGTGKGCVYNGHVYMQGQTWDDGCQYSCQCMDGSTGQYRCTEKCTAYTNIPVQCKLVPIDQCCKTIQCDFTHAVTTLAPIFAQTTPVAGAAYCKYQGYYHRQGESWNDGCGLTCRCEDAANHYYQCTDRCPKYDNVPSTCTFVPDPKDPQCCRVPQCQGSTGAAVGGFTGTFTGYGRPTSIDPVTLQNTGYSNKCLYKGQVHSQGDRWQDGCEYECECVDASKGMYRCTERCRRVASVPTGCTFVQDPQDACCQIVRCDPTASLGTCQDKLANCDAYGSYICGSNYKDWATANCPKYCGYCGGGTNPLAVTSPPDGTCRDNIPDCNQYDQSVCSDAQYIPWAGANCAKYCNLCGTMTGTGTGTGTGGTMTGTGTGTGGTMTGTGTGTGGTMTGTGTCNDVLTNCHEYTQEACRDQYVDWAKANCPRFCGYCDALSGGTVSGSGGGFSGYQTIPPGSGGFTGFSGGCVYKGRYYGAGDKWMDGCEYNCTCENGQTGFYRCVSRCPTYQLASGCVMKTNPGECCGVPDCSGATGTGSGSGTMGGTITGTGTGTGTSGTQTGTTTGCFYKNVMYQQDQTWKDGCQYKCTCVDATAGQYSCAALCLTWNLPSSCHLDPPAAGKCCQTPNCPPEIVLQYPAGYVPE